MINLTHKSGATKSIPTGLSITSLFFGCFVPLFRGDFKWAIISFLVCIGGSFLLFIPTVFMWFWLVIKYNEQYLIDLTNTGWEIDKTENTAQSMVVESDGTLTEYSCPNCKKDIKLDFKTCPYCSADFSVTSAWKPIKK